MNITTPIWFSFYYAHKFIDPELLIYSVPQTLPSYLSIISYSTSCGCFFLLLLGSRLWCDQPGTDVARVRPGYQARPSTRYLYTKINRGMEWFEPKRPPVTPSLALTHARSPSLSLTPTSLYPCPLSKRSKDKQPRRYPPPSLSLFLTHPSVCLSLSPFKLHPAPPLFHYSHMNESGKHVGSLDSRRGAWLPQSMHAPTSLSDNLGPAPGDNRGLVL